jgi:murein DD-endopeptidase MepM/ murein hydrolase activator NlpD
MRKDITLKPEELKKADPMKIQWIFILLVFLITSCAPTIQDVMPSNTPIIMEATPTLTPEPTQTPIPPTPTPNLSNNVCSPLQNESLSELSEIITREFIPTRLGFDEGHPGLDFSFFRRKDLSSIDGLPVLSALDGVVSTILIERLPYGHAVIIETPLENISPELLEAIQLPNLQSTVEPDPKFNCLPPENPIDFESTSRSIYIIYAHLKNPVTLNVGQEVKCGQEIGNVGDSGKEYSTNPHLHFETRIGPSGARFDSMAYYTLNSTQSERYNYCVWRVSNLFQLFDPMLLLSAQE